MAQYIFPPFIFITSLFILLQLIKPPIKFVVLIWLLGSGFITYLITTATKLLPHNSTEIFSISFIIELIVLIVLFLQKKKDNSKYFAKYYSIIIVITFLYARGCYNSDKYCESRDKRLNEMKVAKTNEIIEYKKQYDFDVDILNITSPIKIIDKKKILKLPLIIYNKNGDEIIFNYELNKSLDISLTSFFYDSINTIVLLENSIVDIGTYSNGATKAQKIETTIRFLDKLSMNEITSTTLSGGAPPSSITYKRGSPISRSGSAPTSDEIIKTIKNELQSKEK